MLTEVRNGEVPRENLKGFIRDMRPVCDASVRGRGHREMTIRLSQRKQSTGAFPQQTYFKSSKKTPMAVHGSVSRITPTNFETFSHAVLPDHSQDASECFEACAIADRSEALQGKSES